MAEERSEGDGVLETEPPHPTLPWKYVAAAVGIVGLLLAASLFLGLPSEGPDLLRDPHGWTWENRPENAGILDGEIVVSQYCDPPLISAASAVPLPVPDFVLRFNVRFKIEAGDEPWLLLIFRDATPPKALWLFPQGDHTLAFAQLHEDGAWQLRDKQALHEKVLVPDRWARVEIKWREAERRLVVMVEGDRAFDGRLGPKETLKGAWSFGFAGAASEVRIGNVTLAAP